MVNLSYRFAHSSCCLHNLSRQQILFLLKEIHSSTIPKFCQFMEIIRFPFRCHIGSYIRLQALYSPETFLLNAIFST